MYMVVGRERIGERRFGRYIVRFETSCRGVGRLYLVSSFTSFYPGRIVFREKRGLCETSVRLWEGVYPYVFMDGLFNTYLDTDNPVVDEIEVFGSRQRFSIAVVGVDMLEKALREGGLHPEYIEHNENDPVYLSRYMDMYVVRLRSLRGEVRGSELVVIDRRGVKRVFHMEKFFSDEYYDYFETLVPGGEIERYLFRLDTGGREVYYGREGLGDDRPIEPGTVYGPRERVWWTGAVYYLVFPDSFYNADPGNDPPDKVSPDTVPRPRGYIGGDLRGLIERLDYLAGLGVDAVYITPVHVSPTYHRYDVIDYMDIDPYLGTIEDFRRLVEEAHKRGIKIVMDMVANHASPCMREALDAIERGPGSLYWSWFRFVVERPEDIDIDTMRLFREFVSSGCRKVPERLLEKPLFYESFYKTWRMIRWNHESPGVLEFFKRYVRYWVGHGVDGFRVDVGHGIPDSFLEEVYRELRSLGEDKVFILEIMRGHENYPLGIDSVSAMNYELLDKVLGFFVYRKIDSHEFSLALGRQYTRLPLYVVNSLYNLLGSHDTPRIYSVAGRDKRLLKTLYTFLFTIYGSPSIYYGDEIGLEGGGDPDNRRAMVWDTSKWDLEILGHIKRLIDLRKRSVALRLGLTRTRPLDRDTIVVERALGLERVVGFFTRDYKKRSVRPRLYGIGRSLSIDLSGGYRLVRIVGGRPFIEIML